MYTVCMPFFKHMRTCAFVVTLLGCGAMPLQAQWATAPVDSVRRDFRQRLLQALDLTMDQQDTLRVLREQLQLDIGALRTMVEDGEILPEEGRLRYRESLAGYRVVRDSVLTPSQLELLERARAWQREQALFDGQGRPDEPQRLAEELKLDDLQRRRWLSLLARLREQVRELRSAGETISTDDYRRLREEYRLSFESILTPDQRLELERVRLARGRRLEEQERQALLDELQIPVEDDWESLDLELDDDADIGQDP